MTAALTTVQLYGPLRKRFGKQHNLAISTPHEAVRALSATLDGFAAFLLTESALRYRVIVGNAEVAADQLHLPVGHKQTIKIVPVIAGNKNGLKLILTGLLLFYGAPLLAGSIGGSTALGGTLASYGMKIGTSLMLGGLMALVSPQRKQGLEPRVENAPSYAFGGAVNTTQQGYPVPLVFGRVITGGATISGGMSADDFAPAGGGGGGGGGGTTPLPRPAEQPLNPIQDDQIP